MKKIFIICAAVLTLMAWGIAAQAADPPHVAPDVTCLDCHTNGAYNWGSGGNIDNTPMNLMCQFCHKYAPSVTKAVTHSSNETGGGAYVWSYECRECHNPHYQEQARSYKTAYSSGGAFLASGSIATVTNSITPGVYNVITVGGTPNWPVNKWVGYDLIGNTTYNMFYRIYNSGANSLTVVTASPTGVLTNYVKAGAPYAITYGTLFKKSLNTRKVIANAGADGDFATTGDNVAFGLDGIPGNADDNVTIRTVKLFNSTGPNSVANNTFDVQAACVVCHTRTQHMNVGYAAAGNSFGSADYNNDGHNANVSNSSQCWDTDGCHVQHEKSFKGGAACGDCHGTALLQDPDDLVVNKKVSGSLSTTDTGAASIFAHPAHYSRGAKDCYLCHQTGMNPSDEDENVGNDEIEIQFSGYAAGSGTYKGRTGMPNGFTYNGTSAGVPDNTMQCDAVYCHSDGSNFAGSFSYASPRWNDASFSFPADCNKCHGDDQTAGVYVQTDRHPKHVQGNAGQYTYNCVECHSATVDAAKNIKINTGATEHVDGTKDVVFGGSIATGGSYTDAPIGTCSSVYCHSNARGAYQVPAWSAGALDCGGCHSAYTNQSPTWSAPHTEHATDITGANNDYSARITCNACHSTVADNSTTVPDAKKPNHVNAIKNVVFAGGGSYNSTDHTCSSVACHSTDGAASFVNTPDWDHPAQGCGYCHGEAKAQATMQSEAKLSPVHFEHVATDGTGIANYNYGNSARGNTDIQCDNCHKGTTDDGLSINQGGYIANHVNLAKDVSFDISLFNTGAPGSWNGTSCSSTYCHGVSLPHGSNEAPGTNPGTGLTPAWSDTAYITGVPSTDCNRCHGAPPRGYNVNKNPGTPSSAHNSVSNNDFNACDSCHDHLNDGTLYGALGAFSNTLLHINGLVEAAGCTGCHGQPPMDAGTMTANPEVSGRQGQYSNGAGAHGIHNAAGYGDGNCEVCHNGGGSDDPEHTGTPLQISMGFTHIVTGGTYQAPAFPNANYTLEGDGTTTVGTAGVRQCSNIYCHSDGAGTYATPNWDATWASGSPGYPAACDQCHGDGNLTGAGYAISTKHPVHAGTYVYNCQECHAATVNGSMTITTPANHIDGNRQVQFGGSSGSDGANWVGAQKTCDTLYCHSTGTANAGGAGLTTADWDLSMPADCTGCHQGDSAVTPTSEIMGATNTPQNTAVHLTHVSDTDNEVGFDIDCSECHNATVSSGTRTISGSTYHVNRKVNVKFDQSGVNTDSPTFATQNASTGVAQVDPGGGNGTCALLYCHSTGNTVNSGTGSNILIFNSPAWGDTLNCTGCHGNGTDQAFNSPDQAPSAPSTRGGNSHVAHVGSSQISCEKCHWGTTNDPNVMPTSVVAGSNHIDRAETVQFKLIGTQTGNYEINGTCTSTYCHGGVSPYWGNAAAGLLCKSCHQSQGPDTGTFNGAHAKHTDLLGTGYDLSCENCHATADSTTNTEHTGGPGAGNQTVEVEFTDATGTRTHGGGLENFRYMDIDTDPYDGGAPAVNYAAGALAGTDSVNGGITWTDGTCTVWCHSNANPRNGSGSSTYASVSWADLAFSTCNECHSSAGNSPRHTAHVATYSFACDECHFDTTDSSNQISSLALRTNHVNASKDVVWKSPGKNSDAAAYVSLGGTCDNLYCHSPGTSNAAPYPSAVTAGSADWDNAAFPTATCRGCHEGDATSGDVMSTVNHGPHVNDSANKVGKNIGCAECHAATVNANRTVNAIANHVNKLVNVKFDGVLNKNNDNTTGPAYGGSGTTGANGAAVTPGTPIDSCSNVYCHSIGNLDASNNPVTPASDFKSIAWNAAAIECDDCHGDDATNVAHPIYASGAAGSTTANSHVVHMAASSTCNQCHLSTITDTSVDVAAMTLVNGGTHLDRQESVGGAGFNWTAGTKTCDTINCHGNGAAQWGDTALACSSCHETTGSDVNDFARSGQPNGTLARIKTSEWTTYGHGNDALTGFITKANGGDPCLWCHDGGATHLTALNSGNTDPFRLKNENSAVSIAGNLNDACLICHASSQTGNYNAGVGTFLNLDRTPGTGDMSAASKIDKWHYGGGHNGTEGGMYCWDCHDPHGDNSNIQMIQALPARTSDANGVPLTVPSTAVVFIDNSVGAGAGGFARASGPNWEEGICNTCHTYSGSVGTVPDNYTNTGHQDTSHATTICTECHKHDDDNVNDGNAFKGAGDCYTCHIETGASAEVEDFGDGTASSLHGAPNTKSTHKESEWTTSGHGRDSGTNYASGNPGAGLVATDASACAACHTGSMVTDGTNPFSLLKTDKQLCLDCHSSAGTNPPSGYNAATQALVGAAHYNTGGGNNARHDTGSYDGGKFCWNCHDPHGVPTNTFMLGIGPSRKLTKDTDQTYGLPADGTVGTTSRTATVTFTATRTVKVRTDYVTEGSWNSGKICQACHVYNASHGMTQYASGGVNDTHNSPGICTDCHKHDSTGFQGVAGEPNGGSSCGACHSDLYNGTDPSKATMHGNVTKINYKHYMNNDATNDVDGGGGSKYQAAGLSSYPMAGTGLVDVAATSATQDESARRCLMCHVDHDVFSPALNSNSYRSANMRTSIFDLPNATAAPGTGNGFNNTDFDQNHAYGGICMSCHYKERFKKLRTPNDATMTPAIPFEMGGTETQRLTKAATLMKRSTHAYVVNGAAFGDNSEFEAVCLKCHNDTIGTNWGPKTTIKRITDKLVGAQQTAGYADSCINKDTMTPIIASTPAGCIYNGGIWNGTAAFGRHISSNDSSMAVMGAIFEQGTNSATEGTAFTLTKDANLPNWVSGQWVGYQVVITKGTGQHSRALVIQQNDTSTLTVASPGFAAALDTSSKYDIVQSPLPQDELCFSCHSRQGQGKIAPDLRDWYDASDMKDLLVRMRDLFVGDSGMTINTGNTKATSMQVCTSKSGLAANFFKDYTVKTGTLKAKITASTATSSSSTCSTPYPSYPNLMTLTVGNGPWSTNVDYEIFKPAFHPLDKFGRHRPYERTTATAFWNIGDEGTFTADALANATSVTDTTKAWAADQWKSTANGGTAPFEMYLYIKSGLNLGKPALHISANGTNSITINTPGGLANAVSAGDAYYIGTDPATGGDSRHVSCTDCHNTHASTHNPEGELTYDDAQASSTTSLVAAIAINSHWVSNEWKGYLLKLRKASNHGTDPSLEQIRFVTAFNPATGTFTVATPWTSVPQASCSTAPTTNKTRELCEGAGGTWTGDSFELLMGDKWTSTGQLGGLAGSGSTGVWGVTPKPNSGGSPLVVSNWPTPPSGQLMSNAQISAASFQWEKVENVFDIKSPYDYGGSAYTGQRDLCVRCHSYYSYKFSMPSIPSGHPSGSAAVESDVVKEFNPQNLAHHAVYARGNNQPITPTGATAGTASYFNPNWPAFGASTNVIGGGNSTDRVSINTAGLATFTGNNIPNNTLPGWFLYVGSGAPAQPATSGWYEVVEVNGSLSVTVKPAPGSAISSSPFRLTAGLGNTFIPPYGPWSILRCTDCHGSTKTDPVGPHASVNKWLIKSLDSDLRFEWWQGGSVQKINPVNSNAQNTQYVCFNCHRRDVYLDMDGYPVTPNLDNANQSRMPHGEYMDSDGNTKDASTTTWPQHCRLCHGGDKLGGIHGTNATTATGPNANLGKRFLNGASWIGTERSTTTTYGHCWTNSSANTVTSCSKGHGSKTAYGTYATYNYSNP